MNRISMTQLRKAERKQVKMRIGLSAPSGAGKTYSALLLAKGLAGSWDKIALIDTENGSGELYSHLGEYNVITLNEPFEPEKYIEAIKACEDAGINTIIIDSITHEWSGKGGCLDLHEQVTAKMRIPNSFTAWAQITPRHQAFIEAILQSNCHIITTVRTKTDYVLTERNGKQVPQKVGMAAVTRDGFEYELTLSLDLDINHLATASKDRTGLFVDKPSAMITEETGKKILDWCLSGKEEPKVESVPDIKQKQVEIEKIVKELGQEVSKESVKKLSLLDYTKENLDEILSRLQVKLAEKNFV